MGMIMKYDRMPDILKMIAVTLAMTASLNAQPIPQYELSVRNPVLTGTTYRFDLYIKRIGPTGFRTGNSQFVMTFNTGAFTAPALSRVAASEQIGSGFFFDQVIAGNEIRISLGGNHSYATAVDVPTPGNGARISTYEISGVSVPVVSTALAWVNLPALVRTGVSEIDAANNYRDITDNTGLSHLNGGGEFGTISGYKFEDLDGDGTWEQPAEPALDAWKIYITGPNGMDSAITGAGAWPTGYYEFNNLTPGSYAIAEAMQPGWSATFAPASPITLTAGPPSLNNNFGNFNGPTARGMAFRDLDGDGVKDPLEPVLQGGLVQALKTGGGGSKTQFTNALGEFVFTFSALESGFWEFSLPTPTGWVGTLPASPGSYSIDIQSGSSPTGINFGLFLASSISGIKFDDLDGDSSKSPAEPVMAGWLVTLFRNATHFDSVLTDVSGVFAFDSLASGTYVVSEDLPAGWTQLLPGSPSVYTFTVDTGGNNFSGSDFGNFRYGAMSGEVYFDLNHDGTRDPGEAGMLGIEILLTGPKTSRSVFSGTNGVWSVDDLLADALTITENAPPGYLLTQPLGGFYPATVTSGAVFDSLNFGNSSTTDTTKFRTMSYDSLVESRDRRGKLLAPEKRKPDKVEFCMTIGNNTGRAVDGLMVRIRIPIYYDDSLHPFVVTPTPDEIIYSHNSQNAYIHWNTPISPDSVVNVCAWGVKPKRYPDSYHHWYVGGAVVNRSTPVRSTSTFLAYRLPLPNRMNVVDDIYRSGALTTGLVVGVERSDMPKFFAWARIRKFSDFKKSIMDRMIVHSVVPKNFYAFDNNRRMVGVQKKVSPKKHNNRIFADALTLKTSIVASQMTIFPPGLGELIFEYGANPLSGKTLRQISAVADTLLTDWPGRMSTEYYNLDSTLRMINASFEGPIDTFSFATTLRFKGTRELAAVPFLRANPGTEPVIILADRAIVEEVPEGFSLYQNYPNPFNPSTTIAFDLPQPAIVTMSVYNLLGAEVGTVLDGDVLDEGIQEIDFEAGSLPSGIYFYRIVATTIDEETGERGAVLEETKKMMLVK